jgi:hypothetical protein
VTELRREFVSNGLHNGAGVAECRRDVVDATRETRILEEAQVGNGMSILPHLVPASAEFSQQRLRLARK